MMFPPSDTPYRGPMLDFGTPWWQIVIRAAVVYLALLVGLRLGGKRQLGQMTPFDLVVILLIANALQTSMVGPDTSLVGGLIAAGVLLVANATLARFRHRIPWLRKVAEGEPVVLVSGGVVNQVQMTRQRIDDSELDQAVREHGLGGVDQVQQAVLEVDGTISIVPTSSVTIRTKNQVRSRRLP